MSLVETIVFKSEQFELIGSLHLPDRDQAPFIIGCHGLFADRRSPKQIALAEVSNRHGIAYFRFDHRGCGDSQGVFDAVTSLAARCKDLYHAVCTMQHHPRTGALAGLFGSSFGGTVVLAYSAQHPIPRLATFAAPYTSKTVINTAMHSQDKERIKNRLEGALNFDLTPVLPMVRNVFVAHGERDELVPIGHARHIHALAKAPKTLYIQAGGDHRMSNPVHQQAFSERFADWMTSVKGVEGMP